MTPTTPIWKRLAAITLASLFTLGLAGCPEDGPAEELGESIDEAAEDVGDSLD